MKFSRVLLIAVSFRNVVHPFTIAGLAFLLFVPKF